MSSPYEPKVGTTDYEILELLRKLCPNFAPYNYLKDIDLYKGSLFGGTNVYFKNGINRTKGMVTTKSNIELYNLNRYPYNFQTISNHNDKIELGWSGNVLLTLLKDLYKKKPNNTDEKVLCLATGQTYELVLQTYITAHPSIAPYPQKKPKYIVPIKKGGRLEFLFNVVTIIDCVPDDIYNYSKVLTEQQYLNLIKYHQHRKNSFGYSRPELPYRFYILDIDSPITQPFERKNIQISTWISFSDIPKTELVSKENGCDDGFATNEEDICNIHEGHLIRLMVNKYERNPIARKKCIEYYGTKCTICDIDFSERYGKLGDGFIHVHHLKPLATVGKEYIVDYKKDLIPVCPNCHAMIHRIKNVENMTIDEIRNLLNGRHN